MEEIKLLNNAYKIYNLDNRENLSEKILNYISARLIANRSSFEQLIEMLNINITFNDMLNAFNMAYKEKNYYKEMSSITQGVDYYSGVYPAPIGNILVETNDVLEIIKYFVRGIKSRNTITISQTEYEELSLPNMVLIIFIEALAKFNISRNTLMIMPFEECFPEEYDETIIIENEKIEVNPKEFSKKYMIYRQDDFFNIEIEKEEKRLKEKNINYEIIDGDLETVLDTINTYKPESISIYTQNAKVAYEFINLSKSYNVFVNSSILNSEQLNNKKNNLYYKKKIMYPSGKEYNVNEEIVQEKEIDTNTNKNSNTYLAEVVNPWYKKIFEKIKKIFF